MTQAIITTYTLGDAALVLLRDQAREATAAWLTENWGERCPDVCEGCACCEAWAKFDALFAEVPQ